MAQLEHIEARYTAKRMLQSSPRPAAHAACQVSLYYVSRD